MKVKKCDIFGCNYPEGECQELCRQTPEESRQDVIGLNGNTGEHYNAPSYTDEIVARIIILKELHMDVTSDVSNGLLFSVQASLDRMHRVIRQMEKITADKIDHQHNCH